MNRRRELWLVILLLLLAAGLRIWDLTRLPPGFSYDELAYIRLTEAARNGDVAVYYNVGDNRGHAGMAAIINAPIRTFIGDGLLGYRIFSVWGGLVALALVYALARRLFGPTVALVALGVMAVNLRAILLARTASAEAFVPLYTTLVLLMLVVAFHLRREIEYRVPATLPFAVLAFLFGLSGYLHHTTLVLGPVSALFFLHLILTKQPLSRRVWNAGIFVVVLATVIATPYLISTLREPSASEPYILYEQRPHDLSETIDAAFRAVGGLIFQGDPGITQNLPNDALVGPAVAVLLILGLIEAVRHWRDPRYALLLIVLLAGILTDIWGGVEPNFSANLVALPAVYILPGIGTMVLWRIFRVRNTQAAWRPVALILTLILVVNLVTIRSRFFDQWRNHEDITEAYHANLGYLAAYLDRTSDQAPVSLCAVRLRAPEMVGLSIRQVLQLMLHREALDIRHSDCRAGLVFINAGTSMRFIFADPKDRRLMPPELADWLKEARPIKVDGLDDGMVLNLNVEQRIQDSGGYWGTLSQTFFAPDDTGNSIPAMLPVALEQNLTFAGYDPTVLNEHVPGGPPIVLITYWRVDGPLPAELGVFAHVLAYWEDPVTGTRTPLVEPWAEANTLDVIPSELRRRDLFAQVSYIYLSENLKPGEYALVVGAYDGNVYNHLGVLDRGQPRGDQLFLGSIQVAEAVETAHNGQ